MKGFFYIALLFSIAVSGQINPTIAVEISRQQATPQGGIPVLVDSTEAWYDTDVDFSVAVPSNISADNFILILVGGDFNQEVGPMFSQTEAPTGFTFITTSGDTSSDNHIAGYYKIATGSESGNFVVDNLQATSGVEGWIKCLVFSGVNTSDPIGAIGIAEEDNGVNAITIPGITTEANNSIAIAMYGTDGSNLNFDTVSGTGWLYGDSVEGADSENYANGGYMYRNMETLGATGSVTIDMQGVINDGITGRMFEIKSE